jgi:hypothetical protein
MKNAILSVVLILISYWIANVMPTDGPVAVWSAAVCFGTGAFGLFAGLAAWQDLI